MAATRTRTKSSSRAPAPSDPTEALLAAGDRTTKFALDVLAGKLVAGPHVRNACRRHAGDLVKGPARGLHYDLASAQHVWAFFENILKLSGGQFEDRPFLLHPSQAFKLGSIFGWKGPDGARRFRRAYVEEGKGNGKSPFAAGVGLYMMTADDEPVAEIYSLGANKDQSKILFKDAVQMCRKSPALFPRRVKFSGGEGNEYNIALRRPRGGVTGAYFRPMAKTAGKTGSGYRPHAGLADELHEHPSRLAMELLEAGFKWRRQPLLLMITNSGSDRKSVCWEEHQNAVRVAAGTMTPDDDFAYVGEVIDDATFSFVCSLDRGDDPLTDRRCWGKANPLLGSLIEEKFLAGEVAKVRQLPGKLNSVLRLNFCRWTDADEGWITREALESVLADFDPVTEHAGKSLSIGLDLSGVADLTAMACVVETGTVTRERENDDGVVELVELPTYDAWIEAWTPLETIAARATADQAPYDVWVREKHLRGVPGQRVRYDYPAKHLADLQADFVIRLLAYDRWAYDKFRDALDALALKIPDVEHPQGGRKRGKPPEKLVEAAKRRGEPPPLGLWMPGSLTAVEALILDRRIRLKRNPVLVSACMSAAIESDPLDNRWLSKRKATQRIDPAVALCMAIGAAEMSAPPKSVYEERGLRRI